MALSGVRTLVLDAGFRPMHAVRWQRAMVLDLLDRVDVLEYYNRVVRTAADAFPLPAVIRHRGYVRKGPRRVALTRRNLLARDGMQCQYCGRVCPPRELTIDHVHPRSRGGGGTWENLTTACATCNRKKGNRTPTEANMPLLSKPRVPSALSIGRQGLFRGQPPREWIDYLPAR